MKSLPFSALPMFSVCLLMIGSLHAQGPGGPGGGGPGGGGGGMMGRPPGGGPGGDSSDTLAMLVKTLNLSTAQKAQIQPIVDAATPQIRAIREEANTKTETVVQSAESQMKPLLTPYQQQVLANVEKNRAALRKGPPGAGPQTTTANR